VRLREVLAELELQFQVKILQSAGRIAGRGGEELESKINPLRSSVFP
jgi:hypothetical protein